MSNTAEYIDTLNMRIKVVGESWSYGAAVTVAQLCEKYGLPFLDRACVSFTYSEHIKIPHVVAHEEGRQLPKGYIFFTHASMADLPCTHSSKAMDLPLPAPKPKVVVDSSTNTRKITTGTKRTRLEFKELQAKCKNAGSFNEWLTALHDVLLVPQFTVASVGPDGKIVWGISAERANFQWTAEDSMSDFVPKSIVPELANILKDFAAKNKLPRVIKTERPLSKSSPRAVVIDAYIKEVAIEEDDADLWVLVIKPVTVENGLY